MSVLVDWQIRGLCKKDADRYCGEWFRERKEGAEEGWVYWPMIEPFSEAVNGEGIISYGLSSHGYDLVLGDEFVFIEDNRDWKGGQIPVIDPMRMKPVEANAGYLKGVTRRLKTNMPVTIPPNSTVIGRSREYIRVPSWLKGSCIGKSTYARCGVIAYITPLESGWQGHLAIEISNLNPIPAVVYPGMGIAQVSFHRLDATPERDYVAKGGRYDRQTGVTLAKV